jgi:peptide deformylase
MILLDKQLSTEHAQLVTKNEAAEVILALEWELRHSAIPGIGLAASQIGINKAVAIVRIPNKIGSVFIDPTEPMINVNLINPILIEADDLIQYNEGCLSFPGQFGKTIRYDQIVVETQDYYEYQAEQVSAKRYNYEPKELPLFSDERRQIQLGQRAREPEIRQLEQLVSICVQHEFSHLLGLTMFDFKPMEIGRNDICPCGSGKKNKKCHNHTHYNKNLAKLFNPNYIGA